MTGSPVRLLRRRLLLTLTASGLGHSALGLTLGSLAPETSAANNIASRKGRVYAQAKPDKTIQLPGDHGPHPDFRTEWWYFTGWFKVEGHTEPMGIQITFFRNAPAVTTDNPRRMAPAQLLFAHAAVARPATGQLLHAERAVRVGLSDSELGLVDAHGQFTLRVGDWQLRRLASGDWDTRIRAREFDLDLRWKPTQAPWLQGEKGYSRKGPDTGQASHYITLPHLESAGQWRRKNQTSALQGSTWMDHEWSTAVLDPSADGWDWVGLHGDDGSSLMAFVIRRPGAQPLWAHATWRSANGQVRQFANVRFEPTRWWTSPRTGTRYPVGQQLKVDDWTFDIDPLMPDQELDTRASTGTIYWEGAVSVFRTDTTGTPSQTGSPKTRQRWGQGYLELTGYWRPLKL